MQEGPPGSAGVGQEIEPRRIVGGDAPLTMFAPGVAPQVESARALAETVVRCLEAGDLLGASAASTALRDYVGALEGRQD